MLKYSVSKPNVGMAEAEAAFSVVRDGWLTHGPVVEEFEAAFAQLLKVKFAVACCNGTSALHLALAALDVGSESDVLVPNLTYVATANAVRYTGARVALVEVDADSWNIDLKDAEAMLTKRTHVIVPVHLYGTPCDMGRVMGFAHEHGLYVVEDAAEALGASCGGSACGTIGECGIFSFYANKIITTGEGGMVVTNDERLAKRLRHLRGQAQTMRGRFWHDEVGFNYRMTSVAAAIGLAQLAEFPYFHEERRRVFKRYRQKLSSLSTPLNMHSAPWLYTVSLPRDVNRSGVMEFLLDRGIETRPVFDPLHTMPMYARSEIYYYNSISAARSGISLPTYPELHDSDVDEIASVLLEAIWESQKMK